MSSNSLAKVINVGSRAYARNRALLPKKIANESINHFKDNWRKQGFDDEVVKPWKPRKGMLRGFSVSKKSDRGRAILVKTGRMRRDFSNSLQYRRVSIFNNAPYSIFHNYGTNKMPQRKFMGESHNLNEKNGVLIMRMLKQSLR